MRHRRLQLPSLASTRVVPWRIAAQELPGISASSLGVAPDCSLDIGFLGSWFEPDFDPDDFERKRERRHINWGAISGMVLSVTVSAGCWAGIGWMIARLVN